MTLDPNILREAREVLNTYSTPAQALIRQNLYGPREARFAGAIVENSFTVISHEGPATESEQVKAAYEEAAGQVQALCRLLRQTTEIIEERVAGFEELVRECDAEIVQAEANFEQVDEEGEGEDEDEAPEKPDNVFVVVFPPLDPPLAEGFITEFVDKLKYRGVKTWVADESDYTRRIKAMTMREIYNVGRVASVVITNRDGTVLDGWYSGIPWIEEVMSKVQELQA
jgi:exonuclease VII small subunit